MRKAPALLTLVLLVMVILPYAHSAVPFSTGGFREESYRLFSFGYKAIPLGDMNGDGYDEFAISDPSGNLLANEGGAVYVFYGEAGMDYSRIRREAAYVSFHGFEEGGRLGEEMAAADFTGDGKSDILVGMKRPDGYVDIYMIDGNDTHPLIPGRQFSIQMESVAFTIYPDPTYGYHISSIGDFNGDGEEDIAICLPGALMGRGEVRLLLSREGKQDLTVDYVLRGEPNERLGVYISRAGDLDGDGKEEFIVGNLTSLKIVFFNSTTSYENLWDIDADGVVDFTGGWNSTGNTFGLDGDDDGWDTAVPPGPYGGTETDVRYFPNESRSLSGVNRTIEALGKVAIEIGGGSPSGSVCSGAVGVEFYVNTTELTGLLSAMIELDYYYWDYGFESDERWWIKARISSATGTSYLGSQLDGDGGGDSEAEVFTLRDENNLPQSGGGHFRQEIVSLFQTPGSYYFDVGGKITAWSTTGEYLAVAFDNISLKYTRLLPITLPLLFPDLNYLGNISSFSGDLNGDGIPDTVLLSASQGAYVIYGGNPAVRSLQRIDLTTYPVDSHLTPTAIYPPGLSGCVIPPEGYYSDALLVLGSPGASPGGRTSAGAVLGFNSSTLSGSLPLSAHDYALYGPYDYGGFGEKIFPVGDINGDGLTDVIEVSRVNSIRNYTAVITLFSREPLPPTVNIVKPALGEVLAENYTFEIDLFDPDGDIVGATLHLHASRDNISWEEVANVTVTSSGRYQIPLNTRSIENGHWYFMANITDGYGHTARDTIGPLEVFNPHPPEVVIDYPFGGEVLHGTVNIRVLAYNRDGVLMAPGVRVYISPDGTNWTFIGANATPSIFNPNLYTIPFDTTTVDDGQYFFKANATNEFGLSDEYVTPGNITIDNSYPPTVHIIYPVGGIQLSGEVTVVLEIYDRDGNFLPEGVTVFLGSNMTYWLPVNLTSYTYENLTFRGVFDTRDFPNGIYSLRVDASDVNGTTSIAYLNGTLYILNVYTPRVRIVSPAPNSTVGGLTILRAEITDRDSNVIPSSMHFYLSSDGGTWLDLGMGVLTEGYYQLIYNFSGLRNGVYFLKASVRDGTNLTGEDTIIINLFNLYPPEVTVLHPDGNETLKGEVEVLVLVTDDGPLEEVTVEIYLVTPAGSEVYLGTALRVDNTSTFRMIWDTRQNPDGAYYFIKAVATDGDGLTSVDLSNSTFQIINHPSPTGEGEKKGFWEALGPSGTIFLIAGIAFLAIILVWEYLAIKRRRREEAERRLEEVRRARERKKEEEEKAPEELERIRKALESMPTAEETAPREEEMTAYERDLMKGFATEEYLEEETPFMVGREEAPEEEEVPYEEEEIPFMVRRVREEKEEEEVAWEEEEELPEEEEEEKPIWDLVPLEEEEEIIWEEEEEEGTFTITCKCGNEIEIPEDYTPPYRFRCPKCGREGVIKE